MGHRYDRAKTGEEVVSTSTRHTILIMGWVRWLIGGSLVPALNLCLVRNSFAERPNLKT